MILNYDDWKLETPPESEEDECEFCGDPCTGEFCSKECEKAYLSDN